jgi:hypothetical protein
MMPSGATPQSHDDNHGEDYNREEQLLQLSHSVLMPAKLFHLCGQFDRPASGFSLVVATITTGPGSGSP